MSSRSPVRRARTAAAGTAAASATVRAASDRTTIKAKASSPRAESAKRDARRRSPPRRASSAAKRSVSTVISALAASGYNAQVVAPISAVGRQATSIAATRRGRTDAAPPAQARPRRPRSQRPRRAAIRAIATPTASRSAGAGWDERSGSASAAA